MIWVLRLKHNVNKLLLTDPRLLMLAVWPWVFQIQLRVIG